MIKKLTRGLLATILAAALYPTDTMAQDQQSLTMPTLEDLIPGGETYRYTENLYGLQWWGDQCIKPEIDSLFAINPKNGRETLLTTRAKVNEVLRSLITPTAGETQGKDEVMHFYNTEFPWPDKPHMLIKGAKRYIVYDFEKNEFVIAYPQAAKERGANIDFSPEGGHIAYTVKNNLYVDNKKVTNEPEGIVCGQSVHRNEFGITKGTFWSPKGNLLAFYRMNESMVTPYPLVDITQRIAVTDPIRYPMAGMLSHQVKVGIYNPATGETLYLDAGDPKDRYFTNISWAPDEKSLFLIEVNRDQNHAKLCQYDAQTGKLLGVLLEERHEKYVEPQQPITSTKASATDITTSTFMTWPSSRLPASLNRLTPKPSRRCGAPSKRSETARTSRKRQAYSSLQANGSCKASSASTRRRRKSSSPPPRNRLCRAIYIRCASRMAN